MSQTELLRNRHRDRLLTNSAAEFLETRADMALGAELAQQPPEFVPELDRFMAQDQVVRPDYYQESQDKLKQFQKTLDAFKTTLAEGKFCERYGIEVKETYTVDDVLVVANTIQQQHKDAGEVHSCMGRIRKFFRATGRNSSTLQRFLEFVPNSEYTSTICGGFTIILEALERLESLRTDMYRALGDIPKTMSRIHRHLKVHFQSARLKHCADMVWVSVFTVLEAIIRELSTKSGKKALKALFKGEAHGLNVSEALEDLKASVSEFETEANICDAERLGQVDRTTDETLSVTKRTETSVRQLSQGMSSFCERFEERMERDREALETKQARLLSSTETLLENQKQMLERREEAQAEQVQVNVYNVFYCFLTASPSFDSKTGTLDNYQTGSRLIRSTTPLSMDELRTTLSTASLSPSPSQPSPFGLQQNPAWQSKSKQAAKRWLREAQRPERVSARDLRSCMQDITAQAGADEQDCIAYILASLELRDWLRATTSQVLVVELRQSTSNGRGSQQYFTAASYASTVLVRSLARTISSPVLTHLCASRETDPENDVLAGGRGLLISLAGQLVAHLSSSSKQPTRSSTVPDLSFLEDDKRAKFSRTSDSVTKLLALFAKLLSLLPSTSEIVYIILDGIWRLPSESRETKKAIGGLLRLVTRQQLRPSRRGDLEIGSVKIKLIITEPFSTDLHEFLDDDDDEEGAMDGHDTTLRRHHHHRKSSSSSLPPPPPSRRGYRTELSVPDHVPGSSSGGAGINVSWVDSEVDAMIHEECSSSSSAVHSSVDSDPDAKKDRHGRRRQRRRNDRLSIDSPTTRHGHRRQSRSLFEDDSESD